MIFIDIDGILFFTKRLEINELKKEMIKKLF